MNHDDRATIARAIKVIQAKQNVDLMELALLILLREEIERLKEKGLP